MQAGRHCRELAIACKGISRSSPWLTKVRVFLFHRQVMAGYVTDLARGDAGHGGVHIYIHKPRLIRQAPHLRPRRLVYCTTRSLSKCWSLIGFSLASLVIACILEYSVKRRAFHLQACRASLSGKRCSCKLECGTLPSD